MHPLLSNLYERFGNLPKQGTAEWIAGRCIGGSDLGTIIIGTGFETREELMKQKVGIGKSQEDKGYFDWGHLFEPVHKMICERVMGVEVHEFGSLPWGDGYTTSPDGVFVASREQIECAMGRSCPELPGDQRQILCVLELKSPGSRVIEDDIPDKYVPQLYSEMCVVPGSECLVFSQAVFRRCAMKYYSMDSAMFTQTFIQRGGDKYRGTMPIEIGLIYIYAKPADDYKPELDETARLTDVTEKVEHLRNSSEKHMVDEYIDFGSVDNETFFTMIKYWYSGAFTARYHFNAIETGGDQEPDTTNLIGVIPWKLLKITYQLRTKKEEYLDRCWPAIEECVKVVKYLRPGGDGADLPMQEKEKHIWNADVRIAQFIKSAKEDYDFGVKIVTTRKKLIA